MTNSEISIFIRNNNPSSLMSTSRRKLIFGVAINDADYTVCPTVSGKKLSCPAYISWRNMLMRVFSEVYHKNQPTYRSCTVCDQWLSFMAYWDWWLKHNQDDWHLDKDFLMPGNKHYAPDTCIFIPQWLSAFVSGHDAARGAQPIGVLFDKRYNLFVARVGNGFRGSKRYIGGFKTKEEAAIAYKNEKLKTLLALKSQIDAIDKRLYEGIVACVNARS